MQVDSNTVDGFHQRWASIDSALGQAPGANNSHNATSSNNCLIGSSLLSSADTVPHMGTSSSESKSNLERDTSDSRNYAFGTSNPTESAQSTNITDVNTVMSVAEKEAALFSWRYPLVYESMVLTQGKEDMVMAAMRILEEGITTTSYGSTSGTNGTNSMDVDNTTSASVGGVGSAGSTGGSEISVMRYKEAERFVEYEMSRS